jgi:hypothetical protein
MMVLIRLRDHYAQIGANWRDGVGWGDRDCASTIDERVAREICVVWSEATLERVDPTAHPTGEAGIAVNDTRGERT